MKWFTKDKDTKINSLPVEHQASFEIVAHKNASKEVAEEAEKANEAVQNLLKRNHFNVKIYLAAGGRTPRKNTNKHAKGI